ncbi:hypothetical protein [Phormidium tenue]|uniref:Uncharacterized protein n=1 Tax=Phormidium tenue FACHB-1050 TaxID=2692857 RepID=A0ABR8CB54_9CYAN|nr:hypothetical protein [Phormidium tenue]MBD2316649.1 hypothetical protein [Phormidium tenue FACHB-1050]
MNAFSEVSDDRSYIISITKEDNRWYVFAEDHNPEDIDGQPENGFKSLYEAKAFAQRFGEYFEECHNENHQYKVVSVTGQAVANAIGCVWLDDISKAVAMHWDKAQELLFHFGEDWEIVSA